MSRDSHAQRFQAELEFVCCLANPSYLHCACLLCVFAVHCITSRNAVQNKKTGLGQQGYYAQPQFIRYLGYLQYWRQPEYARFVMFPLALEALHLLQNARFRAELSKPDAVQVLHGAQFAVYSGDVAGSVANV
jgi:mediator of RNA polymerase II transcription subunit 31